MCGTTRPQLSGSVSKMKITPLPKPDGLISFVLGYLNDAATYYEKGDKPVLASILRTNLARLQKDLEQIEHEDS